MFHRHLLLLVAISHTFSSVRAADNPPNPRALLAGVLNVRLGIDNVRAQVIRSAIVPPHPQMSQLMEWSGDLMRLEEGDGEAVPWILVRGRDSYFQLKTESVVLFDDNAAKTEIRCPLFDFRLLGLATVPAIEFELESYIWLDEDLSIDEEQVEVNGVPTWHVSATKPTGDVFEYWIEEPGFRVHKSAIAGDVVESQYGVDEFPIPSDVKVRGSDPPFHRETELRNVEWNVDFSTDRFELSGIDIPVNTPIHDWRISRRIGYWTGSDISENPTRLPSDSGPPERQAGETPDVPSDARWGPWPYVLGGVFFLGVAYYARKRQAG